MFIAAFLSDTLDPRTCFSSSPPRQDGLPDWLQPQAGSSAALPAAATSSTDKSGSVGGGETGKNVTDGAADGLDWLQALATRTTAAVAAPSADAPAPLPAGSGATELGLVDSGEQPGEKDWLAAALRGETPPPPGAAAKPTAAVATPGTGVVEGDSSPCCPRSIHGHGDDLWLKLVRVRETRLLHRSVQYYVYAPGAAKQFMPWHARYLHTVIR